MSFNYSRLNLEALAALPLACKCQDKIELQDMKQLLLNQITSGKIKKVFIGNKVWSLVLEKSETGG